MSDQATLDILIQIRSELAGLNQATQGIKETTEEGQKLSELFRAGLGIGSGMQLATEAIMAVKGAIREAVSGAFDLARQTEQGSKNLRMSAEAYQVLGLILRESGGDVSQLTMALSANNRSLVEARTGAGAAAAAYRDLGLNARELEVMSPEKRLETIGRAIMSMSDQEKAFSDAGHILGTRNLPTLLNALKTLATEGYDKLANSAKSAGLIMDDDTSARVRNAEKALEEFKTKMKVSAGESISTLNLLAQSLKKDFFGTIGDYLASTMTHLGDEHDTLMRLLQARVGKPADSATLAPQPNLAEIQKQVDLKKALFSLEETQMNAQTWESDPTRSELAKREQTVKFLEREIDLRKVVISLMSQLPPETGKTVEQHNLEIIKLKQINEQSQNQINNLQGNVKSTAYSRSLENAQGVENPAANTGFMTPQHGITAGAADFVTSLGSKGQQVAATMKSSIGGAISSISQGLTNLITQTGNWKQELATIGTSVLQMILQTIIQMGVQMLVQAIIGRAIRKEESADTKAATAEKAAEGGMQSIAQLGPIYGTIAFAVALAAIVGLVAGMRESGGDVQAGQAYVVGEKRPELFVPTESGTIIPSLDDMRFNTGSPISRAGGASAGSGSAMGSSGGATAQQRPMRMIVVNNMREALKLSGDPHFENQIVDIMKRRRGEVFG